jgi:hypothetical protein
MNTTPLLLALAALTCPATAVPLTTPAQEAMVAPEPWAKAVQQGRALIAQGKGEEARLFMRTADKADAGAFRTRLWYVRALIEAGFLNDALNFTDDLSAAGQSGPAMDYLYGMAFVHKARKYIAESVDLSMVAMNFRDAVEFLGRATAAQPHRFGDAFLPLAEAAWNSQRLDLAREAAQQSTRYAALSGAAFYMLGEVAFSQFVVSNGDDTQKEQAKAHWQVTYESFQTTAELEDKPGGDLGRLANAYNKMGHALIWVGRREDAETQYAAALGVSPAAVDIGQLFGSLEREAFERCLQAGAASFAERHTPEDPGDATLLWWIGYTHYIRDQFIPAQGHFKQAYAKWPAMGSSQWYVALCQDKLLQPLQALETVIGLQASDAGALNDALKQDLQYNLSLLDTMVAYCYEQGRLVDAGRLSAAQGNASPDTARYWNNVGLFYRDAGKQMPKLEDGVSVVDRELQARYFEKALEGYERALGADSQDPVLINDTAVVLHYFLKRDLSRARRMYLESMTLAQAELQQAELNPLRRSVIEATLKDAKLNFDAANAELAKK